MKSITYTIILNYINYYSFLALYVPFLNIYKYILNLISLIYIGMYYIHFCNEKNK